MPALTPKQALQDWAKKTGITSTKFANDMSYTYNYAYQLLKGDADVTLETLGRFVVTYGTVAAQPIAAAFQDEADMDGDIVVPVARPRAIKRSAKSRARARSLSAIDGVSKGITA